MARYSTQCYPTFGNNATTQNLFTVENKVGSRVNVYIRRLAGQLDPVIALTSVMPLVKTSRASAISGGIELHKEEFNTLDVASNDRVIVRSPLVDSAQITATPGATVWQQYTSRNHTGEGQVLSNDNNLLPYLINDIGKEFILRPGEAIVCQVAGASTASNPANNNQWFVECVWEEVALATFNISGTVTLSGSPVSGAIITVIEADDETMTNAILVETITTGAGGDWASTISVGKVGAAFVQYKSGATYYTAPGSPYLE